MDDKQSQQGTDRTAVRIVPAPDSDAPGLAYLEPVRTGDVRQIVASYQQAVEMAATLRLSLRRANIILDDSDVDALLNARGEPVLRVELTPDGRARLERMLEYMARSWPPSCQTEDQPPATFDSG